MEGEIIMSPMAEIIACTSYNQHLGNKYSSNAELCISNNKETVLCEFSSSCCKQ